MPGDPLAVRGIQGADGNHDGRWLPNGVFAGGHAMQYKGFPQSPPAISLQIAGRTFRLAVQYWHTMMDYRRHHERSIAATSSHARRRRPGTTHGAPGVWISPNLPPPPR